jgi:anhydro-N-acetylmuramic acid kinase
MSGTSLDGIDGVLLRVRGSGVSTRYRVLSSIARPFPPGLKKMLLRNSSPGSSRIDDLTRLHMLLGQLYAETVIAVARKAQVPLKTIRLIGSHGQTVHHLPSPRRMFGRIVRATLQIGDPSVIAALTGITTVGDFRTADMALGGQGAPLVPYFDWLVFRSLTRNRILLNMGGIANITVLPGGCRASDVVAFDTGPGNIVIDALMKELFGKEYDRGGATAARGTVSQRLLRQLLRHPYLRRKPPKSTGREMFGKEYVRRILQKRGGLSPEDVVATVTFFTAQTVYDACRRFPAGRIMPVELIVSGGGAKNRFIMTSLGRLFSGCPVRSVGEFGVPADGKEAICFAILAYETMAGVPTSIPSVTGASQPAILGKICLPPRKGTPPWRLFIS